MLFGTEIIILILFWHKRLPTTKQNLALASTSDNSVMNPGNIWPPSFISQFSELDDYIEVGGAMKEA